MTELEAILILNAIPGFGNNRARKLIEHFGSAQKVLTLNPKDLTDQDVFKGVVEKISRFPQDDFLKEESDLELASGATTRIEGLAPILQKAIDNLPDDYRTAFVLCDIQRLPYQQIAEVMCVPVGTVKSRINRARSILREKLKPYKELQYELSRGIPQTISLY